MHGVTEPVLVCSGGPVRSWFQGNSVLGVEEGVNWSISQIILLHFTSDHSLPSGGRRWNGT